ncbi:uncharacterized protein LOC135485413 isoform X2 [Lineus longissimus]
MQTDDDVGKVAAPVPVIISRALELFLESLILKTNETTRSRNARTLTCSHIKQTILSEGKFDFLKDLVANVPDVQVEEEDSSPPKEAGQASGTGKPRGRPRKPRPEGAPPLGRPRKRKTPTSSTDESCDNNEARTDEEETDEASEYNDQDEDADVSDPMPTANSEQPPLVEVGKGTASVRSPNNEHNSVEDSAAIKPSTSENETVVKQEIRECESGASMPSFMSESSVAPNSPHEQENCKREDFKQVHEEQQEVWKQDIKTEEKPSVSVSSQSLLPKVEVSSPSVQKRDTAMPNFPHHIENLIRPDGPKRDGAQVSFQSGMNDSHLPKDHDNNIAGKCPPQLAGMQLMDLSGKTPAGFPMHLPPQMILAGPRPPCLPVPLPVLTDASPLAMTQQMQLTMPPPVAMLPNTQTQEDDDYDS